MVKSKDWKRFTIYVLPEEHMAIRRMVLEKGTSVSEYTRNILVKEIEEANKVTPETKAE